MTDVDLRIEPRWERTKVLYVRMPEDLHARIRRVAKRFHLRRAELVRQILTQVLAALEAAED